MKTASTQFLQRALAGCFALAVASSPVAASTPDNLKDILNQDYGWGADQMNMRGYTIISSDYHRGKTVEYWWNP